MSIDREQARLEARFSKDLQDKLRLSEAILSNFSDMNKGGPIAYLLTRAAQDAAEAAMALTATDPTAEKEIRRLQNDIERYRDTARWINEALASGQEAWTLLNMRERTEILDDATDSFEAQE